MNQHDKNGMSIYSAYAIKGNAVKTEKQTKKWMHKRGQICLKCQKESMAEKGCSLRIMAGLKLYVCKACVDAKKSKEETT